MSTLDNILDELKRVGSDTRITLNNGISFCVSDIAKVNHSISVSDMEDKIFTLVKEHEEIWTLEDFIKEVSTININNKYIIKQSEPANSDKPIRSNAKFIYQKVLFKEPINLTVVEYNNCNWVDEPFDAIIAWDSFIRNQRALPDIFRINGGELIMFNQLDEESKSLFKNAEVRVRRIMPAQYPNRIYLNLVSTLFNIAKCDQDAMDNF